MKAIDFFKMVKKEDLSEFDIYHQVQDMTNNFQEDKLNLLCEAFDEYIFFMHEEWAASFSKERIQKKMDEFAKAGIKIPVMSDERPKFQLLYVSDFFLHTRFGKTVSDEEYEKGLKEIFGTDKKDKEKSLDTTMLFGGFYFKYDTFNLDTLRDILVKLKRKHTDAVYRFDDKKPEVKDFQAIHWLKREESLRLFIDELKSAGLIEEGETENIIQEHFFVDGQAPTKEPKPIAWKGTKVLLAHLINGLEKSVENKNIWKDLAPHFEWKGKTPDGLRQSYNDNPHPNNIEKIESIIKQLSDSE